MANENGPQDVYDRSRLLTPEEREACGRVAAGCAPHSQRALALMALDQGVTQAEAGELSGLTKGQVRYWRDRFRDNRLGIFPNDLLARPDVAGPKKMAAKQAFESEAVEASRTVPAAKRDGKPKKKKSKKKAAKGKKAKTGKPKSATKREKRKKKGAKKGKKPKGKKGKSPAKADGKPKKRTKKAKKSKSKAGKSAKAKKKK